MCKNRVRGVGAVSSKIDFEQVALLGGGAIGSKFAVNQMVNRLNIDEKVKKWIKVAVKIVGGVYVLAHSDNHAFQTMAIGAIAAGTIEAAEVTFPSVFSFSFNDSFHKSDNETLPAKGMGNVIDLNDSDWSYVGDTDEDGSPIHGDGESENGGVH